MFPKLHTTIVANQITYYAERNLFEYSVRGATPGNHHSSRYYVRQPLSA